MGLAGCGHSTAKFFGAIQAWSCGARRSHEEVELGPLLPADAEGTVAIQDSVW